jgi:hypothetical protein
VNGKVYDAAISFDVASAPPVSSVTTTFESYAPSIPSVAYPAEAARTPELRFIQRTDGTRTYSAAITNLKGGKEYKASVDATNPIGEGTAEYETPYVRELEKFSANDFFVGAYYYPWYNSSKWQQPHFGTPLLGLYDSQDTLVQSKHIDWASGNAINFFVSSWQGHPDDRTLQLLQNQLSSDISIGIVYESLDLLKVQKIDNDDIYGGSRSIALDDDNTAILSADFDKLASTYFENPQYWRLDGKPAVFLYVSSLFSGDLNNVFGQLRDIAQNHGFGLFIVGDEVWWDSPDRVSMDRLRAYDAITSYLMTSSNPAQVTDANYESRLNDSFAQWSNKATAAGIKFIPFATPGYASFSETRTVARDAGKFKNRLGIAAQYVDENIKALMVTTFNEWFEYSYVEPGSTNGFDYLQTLHDSVAGFRT